VVHEWNKRPRVKQKSDSISFLSDNIENANLGKRNKPIHR
jgi:hypothetical protein